MIVTLAELKAFGDITSTDQDNELQVVLNQAISIFKRYLQSPIEETTIEETIQLANISTTLMPKYRTINEVTELKFGDTTYAQGDDFIILEGMVLYNHNSMFNKGVYDIKYKAGFKVIEDGLKHGVMILALWFWQRGDSSAIYETKVLIPEKVMEIMRQYGGFI